MQKSNLIPENIKRLSNKQIVDIYLENGLIQRCVDIQFIKLPKTDYWKMEFKDDFFQDLIVFLLTYDNEKINNAHYFNHMNALITRIIQNQIYSKSSKFYCQYLKLGRLSREIDGYIEDRYLGTKEED